MRKSVEIFAEARRQNGLEIFHLVLCLCCGEAVNTSKARRLSTEILPSLSCCALFAALPRR